MQAIFEQLNREYFEGGLTLPIGWSGSAERTARTRRRLGSYHRETGQIRIHRLLDQPHFPPYFISYVVYHEMLHHVCPPRRGKRGKWSIHHADFNERERDFKEYALARAWEKENLKELIFYGRS